MCSYDKREPTGISATTGGSRKGFRDMSCTLAIDFGSKNIGLALVEHTENVANRVLYAGTMVVAARPLNAAVQPRAMSRRMRRSRKTHAGRLRRLGQALAGINGAREIVRFCRRRGYSHEPEDSDESTRGMHFSREDFFDALRQEINRVITLEERDRTLRACSKHLNEARIRTTELRPARFENRGPTKCQWIGCRKNVPRAANAIKERIQQALYAWMKPIFDECSNFQGLRHSVDHWILELDALAHWYAKNQKLNEQARKEKQKLINKRKNLIYKHLKSRVCQEVSEELAEKFRENWTETYGRNITEIITGVQGGRTRYCREHSNSFVEFFLAGKQIPNRTDITMADLFGRKQQILFSRIWRLLEERLLPLAGGQIDRVVVERVAFSILAGKAKDRRELSEDKASEMYWYGPQYGFSDRREMFKEEFGGRCAYCGQTNAVNEVEHLLPRNEFPFDSYLNVLPACSSCNARKGARTAFAAGMTINRDAYQAYADYVGGKKPPHLFHTIKKGMLNLLSKNGNSLEVEKQLGMLADNLVTISATQKGPRPLARYLAGQLSKVNGHPCETLWISGRHTALYRKILLPEYDKQDSKAAHDLINHAVDAIILGCKLPSAAAIENRRWYARARDINDWRDKVRAAGPAMENGIPRVEPVTFIPFFEGEIGNGYCSIDLSAFSWNRKHQSGHLLDPVGMTDGKLPIKREPATEVFANLKDQRKRDEQIKRIAHPALKKLLESNPKGAAEQLIRWLQQSVQSGLSSGKMGKHPSDQARKRLLEEFVNSPVEIFLKDDKDGRKDIPQTIGIRCLIAGSSFSMFDVTRCDTTGRIFQHYKTDPHLKALYVGYCKNKKGVLEPSRPVLFCVNQIYAVTKRESTGEQVPDIPADSPLRGRALGSKGSLKEFLAMWQNAFDELCRSESIIKRFRITQGCVIEKTDGTFFQLRNFARDKPWMKSSPFRNIRRVYRSPFQFLK